jgi:hypothetical protein
VLEEVTRSRDNDALLKEVETVGNEMWVFCFQNFLELGAEGFEAAAFSAFG